jgi:hypothetical protein
MSKLWWKDEYGEEATTTAAQGLSPAKPRKEEDVPPPPTDEQRARVQLSLQTFKDVMNPVNPAHEAARKERQAELDGRRAAAEEHTRRMEYILRGYEPPTNRLGITMSLAMARSIGLTLTPRASAPAPNDGFLMPAEEDAQ